MATQYSSNATVRRAARPALVEQGKLKGRIHYIYDEFQPAAAVVANAEVIEFAPIPAGARVVDCVLSFPDQGTTGSCKVGHKANTQQVADDDAFLASVNMNAAADTRSMIDEAALPGLGKLFLEETVPMITMTAATDASSTTVPWILMIAYVID